LSSSRLHGLGGHKLSFTLRRFLRVLMCAAIFATGLAGAFLVMSESALTQQPTGETEPPPPDDDPPPPPPDDPPPPPPDDPPQPPAPPPPPPPPPPTDTGSSGPSSAPVPPSPPEVQPEPKRKPKPKAKKKKPVEPEAVFAGPTHPPADPPAPPPGPAGGSASVTPTQFSGGGDPLLAAPLRTVLLSIMAFGAALLLVLASMPLRSLAGVSVRLAHRRAEVGLITLCVLLATGIGFLASLLGA